MYMVEALKKKKELLRKADDLRSKVAQFCVDMDFENPVYETVDKQTLQIKTWIQAHSDVLKEISRIQTAIARTNLATEVTIALGGKLVTKSVTEWVLRKKELCTLELAMWMKLTDKNLKDSKTTSTTGQLIEMKVRRYFTYAEKDAMVQLLREEPILIDGALEISNARTELIEN